MTSSSLWRRGRRHAADALHDLVAQNPWFEAGYHADSEALRGAIQHTNRALELYGGVRGKFTRDLAFNAQARTTTYRDFGFWVNESRLDSAGQRFSLAYDTLTVASVIGEASWRGQGALELSARAIPTYGRASNPMPGTNRARASLPLADGTWKALVCRFRHGSRRCPNRPSMCPSPPFKATVKPSPKKGPSPLGMCLEPEWMCSPGSCPHTPRWTGR